MKHFRLLTILLLGFLFQSAAAQDSTFKLTILHTNDTHAHHEPNADDIGGVARQATVVKEVRQAVDHALLLDAGDRFTGSLFHTFYLGQDNVQVMNALGYDAMGFGSYEFTHGAQVLADFISGLGFPLVSSNIDFSQSELLAGKVQPYVVLEMGGEQVGIIAITRVDSRIRPLPEVAFNSDYAGVVQAVVDELAGQGVNKIILISHLDYFDDLGMATQVSGVDVIVGGNSNTLLSNTLPDAEGPYPTEIASSTGEPVLVVQAYFNNEVLGRLEVSFDSAGILTEWLGDAIQLTPDIPPDPDMQAVIDELQEPLGDFLTETIGETTVRLDGERELCRFEECNLGNLIADALREAAGVQIGLHNGGAIRASIEQGEITAGAVLDVLPFSNTYVSFEISGADLITALENSVSRTDSTEGTGRFLQVSGLRFTWDGSRPVGQRIVNVEIQNDDGSYSLLDPFETYTAAINDFEFVGGDDYLFEEVSSNAFDSGITLDQVVRDYIAANTPLAPQVEGRIVRADR